jgi:radical SAM/Cys-rich protein
MGRVIERTGAQRMHDTLPFLEATPFPPIRRGALTTLQINLGYRCNQSCVHCHVAAGPNRTEAMSEATLALVCEVLDKRRIAILDLTGGAPELHPGFHRLVTAARDLGVKVVDRCNLTILLEDGQEDIADFLAHQRVEVVASLPCYLEDNVDRQRGKGVFEKSIAGLKKLNALGYGDPRTGLVLNLVFNPQGPSLPPNEGALEADYKRVLSERFGVVFNELFALANMPIQRFGSMLVSKRQFDGYMALLQGAHRPENLAGVMCRSLVSVDYEGFLHDCDFNQMLRLPLGGRDRAHLRDLLTDDLQGRPIRVAGHCFGCTAGQGSSCGGALEAAE